ncbi:hypothetical protein Rs2_29648 [Raphanus sativus]|nr:hypothetical protein Rs2_29648 [Raphanus sativus]
MFIRCLFRASPKRVILRPIIMRMFLSLLLLLTLTPSSSAIYCLCKDGIGDNQLQTTLEYACAQLADCKQCRAKSYRGIRQDKGPCYQPNTMKSHCDWAVNSYFQKAAQAPGSCNFSGTATSTLPVKPRL